MRKKKKMKEIKSQLAGLAMQIDYLATHYSKEKDASLENLQKELAGKRNSVFDHIRQIYDEIDSL